MKTFYMTKNEKVKDDYREMIYIDTIEKFIAALKKAQFYKKSNCEKNIYDSLTILFKEDFHLRFLSDEFNSSKVLMTEAISVLDIINCNSLNYKRLIEMQNRLFKDANDERYFVNHLLLIDIINEKLISEKCKIKGLARREKVEYFEEFLRVNPETFEQNVDMIKDIQNLDFDSLSEIIEDISKKELEFLENSDISYEDKFNAIKEIVSKKKEYGYVKIRYKQK